MPHVGPCINVKYKLSNRPIGWWYIPGRRTMNRPANFAASKTGCKFLQSLKSRTPGAGWESPPKIIRTDTVNALILETYNGHKCFIANRALDNSTSSAEKSGPPNGIKTGCLDFLENVEPQIRNWQAESMKFSRTGSQFISTAWDLIDQNHTKEISADRSRIGCNCPIAQRQLSRLTSAVVQQVKPVRLLSRNLSRLFAVQQAMKAARGQVRSTWESSKTTETSAFFLEVVWSAFQIGAPLYSPLYPCAW